MKELIENALKAIAYPTCPEGLYEPIAYVLDGGGKRIRPTLLLMAYSLYRDDIAEAMPAAVGIETYHNHTLLHDDLMDHADMRHGRATVHKKWDANTAILSGDTMLIMALEHVMRCKSPHTHEVLALMVHSAREIGEGQQYDINFESRTDVSVDEYIEMIRLKTSVLLGCATKMGAVLAGAPKDDADALYDFAERIGLAFQLQDDYLDVYGDPAVVGKKTYLMTRALQTAAKATAERLLALLAANDMAADEKISAVTAIYNALGIPALTLQAIDAFYADARRCLDRVQLPQGATDGLWQYAQSLLGRTY